LIANFNKVTPPANEIVPNKYFDGTIAELAIEPGDFSSAPFREYP
jgi:hypothetical protein